VQLWHLTLAARTRHTLFPDEALRLRALRKLLGICAGTVVLFGIVDDHLHWVVLCDERRRGYLARSVRYAVQALSGVETKPVHVEPIHGRSHLETVRRYILRQPIKHGLSDHPALWTGGAFVDLVGARWIPGLALRLLDVLPRCTMWDLCRDIDLPPATFRPSSDDEIRAVGARALATAAAAACCAPTELRGTDMVVAAARRTASALGREAGLPTRELAWALDIHPGSVRKLLCSPVAPEALAATRVRITLEQHVAKSPDPSRDGRKGDHARGRTH
jgi:REP element-mobilizing transposase RayT